MEGEGKFPQLVRLSEGAHPNASYQQFVGDSCACVRSIEQVETTLAAVRDMRVCGLAT
jgi:hypothetical protein